MRGAAARQSGSVCRSSAPRCAPGLGVPGSWDQGSQGAAGWGAWKLLLAASHIPWPRYTSQQEEGGWWSPGFRARLRGDHHAELDHGHAQAPQDLGGGSGPSLAQLRKGGQHRAFPAHASSKASSLRMHRSPSSSACDHRIQPNGPPIDLAGP